MAEWKKVVVSGSQAELAGLKVGVNQQISSSVVDTFLSGSFSGSFYGTFNGAGAGNKLEANTYDGNWGGGYFQTGSAADNVWEIGVTTVSTAIDDINELLGSLVSVTDFSSLSVGSYVHTAGGSPTYATSKNLSFGANQTYGTDTNNYYPVRRSTDASTYAGGLSNINLNGSYTANDIDGIDDITLTSTRSSRIIHLASNNSVVFTLKGSAGTVGTAGTVNGSFPTRYFHEGVLEVYVNDSSTPAAVFSLSGSSNAINTTTNNVTLVAGAVGNVYQSILGQVQATQASGNTHKYRAGVSVTVANAAFRDGWNWIAIKHNVVDGVDAAGTDKTLKLFEFIKHSDSSTLTNASTTFTSNGGNAYNNFTISQNDGVFAYLSGVKYFTETANVSALTSSMQVVNAYKMVHPTIATSLGTPAIGTGTRFIATGSKILSADAIDTTNSTANAMAAASIPNLNVAASTPFDSTLTASIHETFNLNSYSTFWGWKNATDIAGGTITVTNNFKSPGSVTFTGFTTGSFYFKKGTATGNTSLKEYFNDESRRLPSSVNLSDANTIAALKTTSGIGSTYGWNSESSLATTYTDGLLCQPNNFTTGDGISAGKLVYPSKGGKDSDGNFTTVALGPSSNANYSSATGVKYFYRNFYLSSANAVRGIGFTAKGNASIIKSADSFTNNSNQIKVDFYIPGYYDWIPMYSDSDYTLTPGKVSRIIPNAASAPTSITVDTSGLNYSYSSVIRKIILNRFDALGGDATVVTQGAASNLSLVVRITVPTGWTGNLTYLSAGFLTGTVPDDYDTTNANITWS